MKRFLQGFTQGLYDAINNIEMYRGQVKREELEEFVQSWLCSIINKLSVFLGAVFIYFFFKLKGIDLSSLFQTFFIFWLAWVISTNHIRKLQKFLHDRKIGK